MSIQIFFDSYNNICYPGQTISGRIECTFNKEKSLHAIRIKFRGRSETAWTESESYYDSFTKKTETRDVYYSAEEVYMDAEYNLVAGGENFSLSAGKHVYPFSYILPPQLPSSFEGTVGNIRYYVQAVVERPWKFDYEARVPLNVASILDLNFIPHLRESVAISDEKTMCSCWCNDAGALTFNLSMPISGYVPGQEINIGAYVQNMTNVNAECVKFKIVANYEYITRYPNTNTRHDSEEIVKCVESGIGAHGEKSWTSTLVIPTNRNPTPGATAPPSDAVPSYLSSAGGSPLYPPSVGGSTPYLPPTEGSRPYPSPIIGNSSSYPPKKSDWIEQNPKDTAASAPPPSYEKSQPQGKK